MKNLLILFFLFVIINEYIVAQFVSRDSKNRARINNFNISPFIVAKDQDSIKIITFLEFPYSTLQFIKKENRYIASYQASIGLGIKGELQREHKDWVDSIVVDDYADSKATYKSRKHFYTFVVSKDYNYHITGELQDLDTRKKGTNKKDVVLNINNDNPILLKPNFLMDLSGDWGFENGKIPTHGKKVSELGRGIDLNLSGFIDHGAFQIEIFITNTFSNDSLIIKDEYQGEQGYFIQNIFIPANIINGIKNDFTIKISQNSRTDKKNITFSILKAGISRHVENIDIALKQMRYILHDKKNFMPDKSKKKDKEKLFYALWKDFDPTPGTDHNELMEEYYRRVAYANENFDGWQPGWETDRGMIYILFGPPDEIKRTNPSMSSSALYQVWSYYKVNKQFVFKDQNGFGDYRLNNPLNYLDM